MSNLNRLLLGLVVCLLCVTGITESGVANEQKEKQGQLEIVGVPAQAVAGTYYTKTDVFYADVQDIEGAFVRITYDDLVIIGRVVEWRRKDNYLKVTVDASLEQKDMNIIADQIEYFTEEERLLAEGNLQVTTEDATVYADRMVHLEKEEKTDFFANVAVHITDGKLFGDHFVIYSAEDRMEFIGSFRGEFDR